MKANSDKCNLLIINSQDNTIKIGNEDITGSSSVKLLGIIIDNKLNINETRSKTSPVVMLQCQTGPKEQNHRSGN